MSYRNAAVRDLAWACFSPGLMLADALGEDAAGVTNSSLALTPRRSHWLAMLDAEPGPLLDHLRGQPATRLGIYFERLWQFFLQADPEVELIAHNLPVRDGGATLGEFDCLYFCHQRSRHVHLELAVKYYLGWPAPGQEADVGRCSDWLGPNSADRLDLKIDRMLRHQSTLGLGEPGRRALENQGIRDFQREVEIKGWLFQPCTGALPLPIGINPLRAQSTWVRLNDLTTGLAMPESECYRVLPRLQWLAPALRVGKELNRDQLLAALQAHFSAQRRPQLVAGFTPDGEEATRFFVVEELWPHRQV